MKQIILTDQEASTALNYHIDVSRLSFGTRVSWCTSQLTVCNDLCASDGEAGINHCNTKTLEYDCVCLDGSVPSLSSHDGTNDSIMCRLAYTKCVVESHSTTADQPACDAMIAKCEPLIPAAYSPAFVTNSIIARSGGITSYTDSAGILVVATASASAEISGVLTSQGATSGELPTAISNLPTAISGSPSATILITATSVPSSASTSDSATSPTPTTVTFRTITASPTTISTGPKTGSATATPVSSGTASVLSVGAKAGIGTAAGVGGLFVLAVVAYVFWRIGRGDRVGLSISIWKKRADGEEEDEPDLAIRKKWRGKRQSGRYSVAPWVQTSPIELPLMSIPMPELPGSVPLEPSKEKEVVHEVHG
ncbi:hypothetical protein BD289DRAFT_47111 [Coniella lustricola]|uniref:DUF7707 domain-containing protein n=1 Tax=Coniella lustricola TaxID=2025994 RepID=A0A2T3AIH1_9PEZI|nr:hypothetical protein BD289DRAFT_47111 [Coniella lustricola]